MEIIGTIDHLNNIQLFYEESETHLTDVKTLHSQHDHLKTFPLWNKRSLEQSSSDEPQPTKKSCSLLSLSHLFFIMLVHDGKSTPSLWYLFLVLFFYHVENTDMRV